LVRVAKRFLEALAIKLNAIIFTRERRDSANGSSGFTCKLGRVLMSLLIPLIFENDDALVEKRFNSSFWGRRIRIAYQTYVAG
jgi:hypothetical protein